MATTRGRQVVVPLTNKSGGSVAAGDVVIIDTANDTAFTTTTSGRSETTVGVAQETIANNATGRVLVAGYAALVNVPASVTRGHYLETYTATKQATGNSTRRSGSFGQFLTGGTMPTAVLWGSTDQTASASAASFSGCKVYHSTTQSFTAATPAAVLFDSEEYDTSSYHSTVSNTSRITVPTTGYYRFTFYGFTSANPGVTIVLWKKNGTGSYLRPSPYNYTGAAGGSAHGSAEFSLTSGDYIEAFLYVGTTGGPYNVGDATNTNQQTTLSVEFLGA